MKFLATSAMLLACLVAAPAPALGATRNYAQELVDRAMARHPEVAAMAMHVTAPKTSTNTVIAASDGSVVGKASSEADLKVLRTGTPRFGVNKAGNRFEAELVLQDVSSHPVGTLQIQFTYKKGDDEATLRKKAEAIRDELHRRIAHVGNLVEDYPFDASIPTRTFAQHLVDEALESNPDVIIIAIHVPAPTNKDYPIIASNIGRIGKKADEDDMEVITTAKPRLEVNTAGDRFESEGALRDSTGKVIGAVGVVFPYKAGDDQQPLHARAEALRAAWAKQIPGAAKLFDPAT